RSGIAASPGEPAAFACEISNAAPMSSSDRNQRGLNCTSHISSRSWRYVSRVLVQRTQNQTDGKSDQHHHDDCVKHELHFRFLALFHRDRQSEAWTARHKRGFREVCVTSDESHDTRDERIAARAQAQKIVF